MQIAAIQKKRIYFAKTSQEEDNKNDSKLKKIANAAAITASISVLALGADLFIAKGKAISGLTRGRVSFIKTMSGELDNVMKQDSYATKSRLEAFLCTPGLHAVWNHRIANKLYQWNIPVLPRLISNISRFFTGIEIHPGAQLGKNIFFDHTGAIVGQTAKIGDNVTIIGRAVLGSTGKDGFLRHTIVEDGVTIGMNSTMLGRITLGKNSTIGAGSVITSNIPATATVIGIGNTAKITRLKGQKLEPPISLKDFIQKTQK
jgi:serine O-acetyltransferase